ncbi:hypothetical protein CPC08DRAFT_708046 [Agrocybe pediades]|nr:hypothetical protein CPC08DRAFT_708046 [Agrocybe pediades]
MTSSALYCLLGGGNSKIVRHTPVYSLESRPTFQQHFTQELKPSKRTIQDEQFSQRYASTEKIVEERAR